MIESSRPTTYTYPGRLTTGASRLRCLILGRPDLLAFSPLLLLYLALVLLGDSGPPRGDEQDYLALAASLARGSYSSPGGAADLWWGPGYPLALAPLVALHAPLSLLRGLNVPFLFAAVLYFYAALRRYVTEGPALAAAYGLGLHPALLEQLPLLMSESLAVLLVCASTFYFCRYCGISAERARPAGTALAPAFCLSFLALTKVLFGYVLTLQLALYGALYAWKRAPNFRRPLVVYTLALALCSPWLLYTYAVSGRAFYWASSGGMSLYWMSSPYPDELGDWHGDREVFETPSLARHHGSFFHELEGLSDFERDDALRARAISNIATNPTKFAENVLSNIGRMLFGSPFTNKRQSTDYLRYLLPNAAVAALVAFCAVPTYLGRRRLPPEVLALLLFSGSAFAASSLLSAFTRQFTVLLPPLGLWLAFTLAQLVRIEIRK